MAGVELRGLEQAIGKLQQMANGGFGAKALKAVGAEALTQVQQGFRESRDPYGEAWLPPLLREGQPLRDTGRLANSFIQHVGNGTITIDSNVAYASTHQSGATITPQKGKWLRFSAGRGKGARFFTLAAVTIPVRRMLPEGELGPIWSAAFEKAIDLVWRRFWSS